MAAVRTVQHIPWPTLQRHLAANWKPGQCTTIIGPRGTGKTHICLELAEMNPYVLILATKRTDPLISALNRDGYHVTDDLAQVLWTADPDHPERQKPLHSKIVYWPRFPDSVTQKQRLALQSAKMREAIGWVDKTGKWTVIIDETMWMVESLKLETEIKEMYFQGRTQGVSVIANAQRPTHVPRLAFSSADYLFLAKTGDRRDLINLREISTGIPSEIIESGLMQLDRTKHEFLFVDANKDCVGIVVAPAR
jgi:hypothetical protein